MIAREGKFDIALADFEGFDPEFLMDVLSQVRFEGNINVIQEKTDEKILDALLEILEEEKYGVGILDSVGAISPISEMSNDLGAANMGRRALLMSQFARKATHLLRFSKKSLFLVNHVHPNIGFVGTSTPGGETIKYLSAVRIRMKKGHDFPDQSYLIEGKVNKNRFGYKDKIFHIIMLSGAGIHIGLTAMYDCEFLKLIDITNGWVKIDNKNLGRESSFFKGAHNGDNTIFEPFIELINGNPTAISDTEPKDDTTPELED